MELSEEEKKAIEDSKELIEELKKHKDKGFAGRLYYKNKPIEDTLMLLLNIIERQLEEIDTWKETENDYEHELTRKDEEIEEMREELEIQKRLIIEQIKRFCELYKPKEGIGEGGLDELAEKILSFSKDYISKDKIRKYFMHEIAFKKRLQREKQKIDKYNRGRFDTIEEILELLEE